MNKLYKLKIFTNVQCLICSQQTKITVSVIQNHQAMQACIQNHTENQRENFKSVCNGQCPCVSSMVLRLCWEMQQNTFFCFSNQLLFVFCFHQAMNKYGVGVSSSNSGPKLSGPELLCQLKEKVDVATLTSDLQPFFSLPWASQLPSKPLTSSLGPYKSCAVVSSAGSLHRSGLGKAIGEIFLNEQLNNFTVFFHYYCT